MLATGVLTLASRAVNELSGANGSAPSSPWPRPGTPLPPPGRATTHLDIQHQLEILELLVRLNRERGLAVLATMHDLNLASLYFRSWSCSIAGRVVTIGPPSEVISESRLADVFHAGVRVTHTPSPVHHGRSSAGRPLVPAKS